MSLDLDTRQRAMLQQMGVRIWWPQSAPVVVADDAIKYVAAYEISTGPTTIKHLKNEDLQGVPGGVPLHVVPATGVAAMDWPALARTVAQCQACKLCTGRRAPVFDVTHAPRQADWLLLGEPPDELEEREGAPFAGPAGQLLDNMLKAIGVSRQAGASAVSAYVSNAVKCRPAQARNPEPQELAACEIYLRREVALVQPKIILALGRFAAQALLQGSRPDLSGTPLGKLRGQIYRYQGVPVIVSYHPAYLLRTQADKARAWADLCLAQQTMEAVVSASAQASRPA